MRDDGIPAMRLLAAGIPLTLLLDLAQPPDAQELYIREPPPPGGGASPR